MLKIRNAAFFQVVVRRVLESVHFYLPTTTDNRKKITVGGGTVSDARVV